MTLNLTKEKKFTKPKKKAELKEQYNIEPN